MSRFTALASAALLALTACQRSAPASSGPKGEPGRPAPVRVAIATRKSVPLVVGTFGIVEAGATVALKPQVTGKLVTVHFIEGRMVNEEDLLFTIDKRPFAAALAAAESQLKKNEVLAAQARRDAQREEELAKKGTSTQLEAEKARADSDALEAALLADRAAIEKANIDLSYCEILAPLTGRAGRLLVDAGNIVRANDTSLAVLLSLAPIYVSFAVPQEHLPLTRRRMDEGELPVTAVPSGDGAALANGTLAFIDNEVDGATGTIRLRARFGNEDGRLWPGEFVRVSLTLDVESGVIVVPEAAVQTGQGGTYVYVVKDDLTAEHRPVATGRTVEGETIIRSGLDAPELVVTDGQLRLAPGAKVEVKEEVPAGGNANR